MRLLFRVLFLQGWLLRERFPHAFPIREPRQQPDRFVFVVVLVAAALGLVDLVEGQLATGVPLIVLGVAWILHHGCWLRLDRLLRADELWLSISWGTPVLMEAILVALIPIAIVQRVWSLVALAVICLAWLGTPWLYHLQRRFLFFRDGIDDSAGATGPNGETSCALNSNVWSDAYWRLPKQILLPGRGQRHVY